MTASRQPPCVTTEVHQIFHAPPTLQDAEIRDGDWGWALGIGSWDGHRELGLGMGMRIGDGH